MNIINLSVLISFSSTILYPIAGAFEEYSKYKIPQGTFDIKMESSGQGIIGTSNDSFFCYKCTGLITMTSKTVKKIVECKDGACKEIVHNIPTAQPEVAEIASSTHTSPNTPQNGLNTTILGLNKHYIYIGGVILIAGYISHKWAK